MTPLHIAHHLLDQTLAHLHAAGRRHQECVVLWLAERIAGHPHRVVEVFRPRQTAASDFFHIDSSSMTEILEHLGEKGLFIPAQIHSHPMKAFHSAADDKWAIVRHVDALSLVLPYFARGITAQTFVSSCAAFRLSVANKWVGLNADDVGKLVITT